MAESAGAFIDQDIDCPPDKYFWDNCLVLTCNNKASQTCTRCNLARYCSRECQKLDFSSHKKGCAVVEDAVAKQSASIAPYSAEERAQLETPANFAYRQMLIFSGLPGYCTTRALAFRAADRALSPEPLATGPEPRQQQYQAHLLAPMLQELGWTPNAGVMTESSR